MSFRDNNELEKRTVGNRWKLNKPLRVLKGEFGAGTILRITGDADDRGEIPFVDEESGETVRFNPGRVECSPYIDSADDVRLISRDSILNCGKKTTSYIPDSDIDPLEQVIGEAMKGGNDITAFEIANAIRDANNITVVVRHQS